MEALQDINEINQNETGITSLELIMAEQTNNIVHGLVKSLLLAIGLVIFLLYLIFRNIKIALIGIVPNLIPLLCVFGLLGFTIQSLDFGSCLVAASALGIAVDNTFHFLLCWKGQASRNQNSLLAASRQAVEHTFIPFCITSAALIVAFSMMLFANSMPVAHFGLLLSVTLVVGLYADLIVLPYLLAISNVKLKINKGNL